jgi:hypothetical protein
MKRFARLTNGDVVMPLRAVVRNNLTRKIRSIFNGRPARSGTDGEGRNRFFGRGRASLALSCAAFLMVSVLWAAFSNGDFETGLPNQAPPSWTVTPFLNPNPGFTTQQPQTLSSLNLGSGGSPLTAIVNSATGPGSQPDPNLGATASLRFPRYGNQSAIVNRNSSTGFGNGQNVNSLSQAMVIQGNDVDPFDGQIHIRFVFAPVLENPGHLYNQQPYYFIQLLTVTHGNAVLYSNFGVSGQPGTPWKTVTTLQTTFDYTDWQLVDIAPGSPAINIGDQVQLQIIAAGCSLGAHLGYVYVDGVGATIPGISLEGTGPATAVPGANITYNLNIANGSSSIASAAVVTFNTPLNTTFQSLIPPSNAVCTTPPVGLAGAVVCTYSAPLVSRATDQLSVTVNIAAAATGSITAGDYFIQSTQEAPLLGPAINTTLTTAQTITFGSLANQAMGTAPFAVSATASSGLPVSVASTTPSMCGVSGTVVTLLAAGQCSIEATQAGNSTYAAATPVTQSFQISLASQTIAFNALANQAIGSAPFAVSASASSGLAVTFQSDTPSTCAVAGNIITVSNVGTCTVEADQAGNTTYAAATAVTQGFQISQGTQTIAFGGLPNQTIGTPPFTIAATASSGLPVSFASTTPACSVSGNTVTLVSAGSCTIQAIQGGNTNYLAAAPVSQTFQIANSSTKLEQTITFGSVIRIWFAETRVTPLFGYLFETIAVNRPQRRVII